jgi:D-sedoheptulose 7-phosphate isomerase
MSSNNNTLKQESINSKTQPLINERFFAKDYILAQAAVTEMLASQLDELFAVLDILEQVVKKGGRIYTFGNGGSACDAMHFAEELVARYLRERPGIRAQHLIDSGTITCWANDYDFNSVFKRQIETLATKDDAVIGFSTSGNSENIILGLEAGNKIGAETILFGGKDGGRCKSIAKHAFIVKTQLTSHIQVAHMVGIHLICDLLEQRVFPECARTDKNPR